MAITVGGIGSGLDVESIVNQLMALERRPLELLVQQEADLNSRLSIYGTLKSALSSFQSAAESLSSLSNIQVFSATSSDDALFTATADSSAVAGSYSIEVTQLAQAHKIASTAGFADANTAIGSTGTLRITVGASATPAAFDIVIDSSNNTLNGIRDAINQALDNTGVTASILNVDDGVGGTESKIVLNSNSSGADFDLALSDVSGSIASTLNMATITGQSAQDALIKVDGFDVTSASNVIAGAIQGITLNIKSAQVGTPEILTIATDIEAAKTSVEEFVDAYNSLRTTISEMGGEGGALQGDSGLLLIERQLRSVFNTPASGLSYQYLSEIGITTQSTDGQLVLDSSRLESQLNSDFSGIANLFADDDQGFAFRFEALTSNLIASDGLIDAREDGINSSISRLGDSQVQLEYRLGIVEARFRAQFTALDGLIAQLNTTGNFLSQQLSTLPGFARPS